MAQKRPGVPASNDHKLSWFRKFIFPKKDEHHTPPTSPPNPPPVPNEAQPPGLARRISRRVVPGLPRAGTFKRQQSELRDRLEPVKPNAAERRTASVDRRINNSHRSSSAALNRGPRTSAPEFLERAETLENTFDGVAVRPPTATTNEHENESQGYVDVSKEEKQGSNFEDQSISTDTFDEIILEELEKKWILNLSMHFRDKSKREKFFVTYAETPTHWRRVTISLDYRNAPSNSLEEELQRTRFQRDKSARIYEAIRESLPDIQFYDTVTNLKLETQEERLHVHVVEDLSEVIHYPPVKALNHLPCRRVLESELEFDSHLSGFVYKVIVGGQVFIKKEIPGPDQVEEFLYEINALHKLSGSHSVIQFGGVVLDNEAKCVKGLLISFAEQGALIDVIYDGDGGIPWERRERWAKQIVHGLSEIHEAGFVQGDFTLSNIVIDANDDAKIIDINRRGCPVGWEPPEVAALLESNQRISMYIGVKSDLYQLGMVLYALATQHDEPETLRPLTLSTFPPDVPNYFLEICGRCLSEDPRNRLQASVLLSIFPEIDDYRDFYDDQSPTPIVIDVKHADEGELLVTVHDNEEHDNDLPERGRSRSKPYSPPFMASRSPEALITDLKTHNIRPSQIQLPSSLSGSDYSKDQSEQQRDNYQNTSTIENSTLETRRQDSERRSYSEKDTTDIRSNLTTEQARNTVATPNISMAYAGDLAHIGTGVDGAHMGSFTFGAVNLDDDDLTIDNDAGNVFYMEEKISVA
ncbi:hypothetical protein SS1G_09733 [Sclerotinia sclerotiorum 1980 UF-70]|uniref:Protein kinase domain-containing protein n=2 Tax=Sclerotinia sclerotiorum (strain ATCC 18683 / 1980 / Ss-1) TaxID=665079 RepID=A7EWM4_SCLS1|nr:hypothetical protein SS1G_09733 [Sclerotinia sclerotiorum 1980 UF-70]APA05331.1 hypothetical protein sscle_01g001010 [Sclerotinia sclerotiorum 1980 UF-70]EDN93866.1 hypothetical protein SS1G_09733 [Sclerotinia sclerotiorum 1980 UF-70]